MIFILTLFIFTGVTCTPKPFVGSTIFYNKQGKNECWSDDELAKLRARKIFEQSMPYGVAPEKMNSRYIREMLGYFRQALRSIVRGTDPHSAILLRTALADTMGAHLSSEILPTARFSYYAGYVPYRNVRDLHDFLEHIKLLLNTQGLGWAQPDRIPRWSNLTVAKVFVGYGKLANPCAYLITKRDSNSCIHLPVPKLDDEIEPSAIALPFKSGGLVSLKSRRSENVLLKYYTTASRCILRNSPKRCRHTDFLNFNNELWHWMKRDVAPHLGDEKLYAAYGGILRIAAAVQSYGKGLSRRNLFEDEEQSVSWHPWKTLTETYIYMDPDWTPKLYVVLVLLAAAVICLLQVCYSYILGNRNGCRCSGRDHKFSDSKQVAYANVDSVIPAMLPSHQSSKYYGGHKHLKRTTPSRTKTSSLGSVKTQKVYDLHENTEKMMAVIMSDSEATSEAETLPPKQEDSEEIGSVVLDVAKATRARSPPKLETSISQVKIEKLSNAKRSQKLYSTSTFTHSEMTYCRQDTGSAWSGSATSTSAQSITSGSSKSRCRRTKSARDLVWARRVASKASHGKSTSGTELDINSYTTPPSQHKSC